MVGFRLLGVSAVVQAMFSVPIMPKRSSDQGRYSYCTKSSEVKYTLLAKAVLVKWCW
jgi:hypothetical protein